MHIQIIGCGFAGAAAALLLHRKGHRITLWEAAPHPSAIGAGILLQPSGQAVLQHLGLLEASLHNAQRIRALQARTHTNKPVLNLPLLNRPTYGVTRGAIFQQLWTALQHSNIELKLGQKLTSIPETADLTVIADGSRSQLRHLVSRPWLHEYAIGALWFCGQHPPMDTLQQVTLGTKRLCGILPTGPNQASLFWSCSKTEYEAYKQDPRSWQAAVQKVAPEAASLAQQATPDTMLFANYRQGWMPSWHKNNLVVIGDAAHPMSPHLGQGINLALLDAYSLAKHLPDLPAYEKARRKHIRIYSTLSALMTPFFQLQPDPLASTARDLFLPLLQRFPFFNHHLEQAIYGQKGSWLRPWQELEHIT